jgi:hypothetical protein
MHLVGLNPRSGYRRLCVAVMSVIDGQVLDVLGSIGGCHLDNKIFAEALTIFKIEEIRYFLSLIDLSDT